MDFGKGWRTLVANGLAAVLALLNAKFGVVELDTETQAAVVVTLMAAVNIGLRMVTTTKVGQAE